MKYIIEIEDEPMIANSFNNEVDELWKAKGFNSLVFDQNGIKKLTPYTEPDRKAIEDEVWKFLVFLINEMDVDDKYECFNQSSAYRIANTMSYQEAKAKYEAWRKQKDKIRVGEELINHTGRAYIIYHIDRDEQTAYGVDITRGYPLPQEVFPMHGCYTPNKTGRYFPEVAELLKKMRDTDDEED